MAFASRPILTVAVSLIIAACGGGGGGSSSGGGEQAKVPTAPTTRQGTTIPPSPSQSIQVPSGRSGSGSIVQTGKVESPTNITYKTTFDNITLSLEGESFGISNQNEWDIKFTKNAAPIPGSLYSLYPYNDKYFPDHEFTHRFTTGDGMTRTGSNYSYFDGFIREDDYLTLGHWVSNDISKCRQEDECLTVDDMINGYGTFVYGNDLFTNVPITGRASYEGASLLTVLQRRDIRVGGKTFLSVDFEKGTIYGRIDNFISFVGGDNNNSISGTLNLNNAEIKNSNSGFFEGNLTGTFNGISYDGTYGGQFYGNNESDGLPGTVAGTMNAVSENNSFVLFGSWFGDK